MALSGDYEINSNREWGDGRSDILLRSKRGEYPHILMEFKYTKNSECNLQELANEALQQIQNKNYTEGLDGTVICIGLAHHLKNVQAVWIVV